MSHQSAPTKPLKQPGKKAGGVMSRAQSVAGAPPMTQAADSVGTAVPTMETVHPKTNSGPKREPFGGRTPAEGAMKASVMKKSGARSKAGEGALMSGAVMPNYTGQQGGRFQGRVAAGKADKMARKLVNRSF